MTAPEDQAPHLAQELTQELAQKAPKEAPKEAAQEAAQQQGQAPDAETQADKATPKAVLLTTTSGDEGAQPNLERMIAGLAWQAEDGAKLVSLILVQQDAAATEALARRLAPPAFVELIPAGGRMSLSAARNLLLARAAERKLIAADDVVAYPDDDSWYPKGLLPKIQELFAADPFFDFFFCRYGEKTEACRLSPLISGPSLQTAITNASSNTIFLRGRVANLIGGFDEELGVGAKHKAGEDLDYALRAYARAVQRGYLDAPLVGHRDKNPEIRSKYFRGSLLVLSRHALSSAAALLAFSRKLAVGALLVGTRRLALRDYLSAIWLAAEEFGRGPKAD